MDADKNDFSFTLDCMKSGLEILQSRIDLDDQLFADVSKVLSGNIQFAVWKAICFNYLLIEIDRIDAPDGKTRTGLIAIATEDEIEVHSEFGVWMDRSSPYRSTHKCDALLRQVLNREIPLFACNIPFQSLEPITVKTVIVGFILHQERMSARED